MALLSEPRVRVPETVASGEVFVVKTIVGHAMATGLSRDADGVLIPRNLINRFLCRYDGAVVFSVDMHESVASNPFLEFHLRATKSGVLEFTWFEDGGKAYTLSRDLIVT